MKVLFKLFAALFAFLGFLSLFGLFAEIFVEHGIASGQHGPVPLGQKILLMFVFGATSIFWFFGAVVCGRTAKAKEPRSQGFPIIQKNESQD